MGKIYCNFCGKENDEKSEKCIKCKERLNQKEHLWKDYLYDHIKDDLKGKVTDKTISLITNYVKSHLYGVILSLMILVTATTGIVNVIDNSYIKDVDENKNIIEIVPIDIESDLVKKLYEINTFNNDLILLNDEGFYMDRYVDYNSFSDESRLYLTYELNKVKGSSYTYIGCDDMKSYDTVYNMCVNDMDSTWFGPEFIDSMRLYKIDINSFSEEYKKLWGADKSLPKVDFELKYFSLCEYSSDNNDYLCHALMQGWPAIQIEITKLIKAYEVGNYVYLYDYYVYCGDGTYKDRFMTKKISDIDYREIYFDDKEDMDILGKGQIYKHRFKKNTDGTYSWVSSEPVDKLP